MDILHITNAKPVGPFLQIYGHQKPQLLEQLNTNITAYVPYLKDSDAIGKQFTPNRIYLAHNLRMHKYFRCMIVEQRQQNKVAVEIIDYGLEYEVSEENVYKLDVRNTQADFLLSFPPVATKYILANFYCQWMQNEIKIILRLINNSTLKITNEHKVDSYRLISLYHDNTDLQKKLIGGHIGVEIELSEQIALLLSVGKSHLPDGVPPPPLIVMDNIQLKSKQARNLIPTRPLQTHIKMINSHLASNSQRFLPQPITEQNQNKPEQHVSGTIPVFISNDLPVGSHHIVYCSFVHDGPSLFSIQLKNQEHILDRMMTDLGNIPLKNLTTKPTIGMACIARYSEDKNIYRAAIMNINRNFCRVTYIDYGNSEDVSFADIYEIPAKFLEHKTFSIQFTLSGCNRIEPIDSRIKDYFRKLVGESELELKVMPLDGPLFVQYCELYLKNRNILHSLRDKQIDFNSYTNPRHLTDHDTVVIRYVKTAKEFFVQRVSDMAKFELMMDTLFVHCKKTKSMDKLPMVGQCCAAMLGSDDKEWYRVLVTDKIDNDRVLVQFVDFGSIAECRLNQLREIPSDFLTLPRQVSECCLIDFEKVTDISETTGKQLEMLAEDPKQERKIFRISLHNRLPDSVFVVNLYDESETPVLNVSASLYKHYVPRKPYGSKSGKNQSTSEYGNSTFNCDTSTASTGKWSELAAIESTPSNSLQVSGPMIGANKINSNSLGRTLDSQNSSKSSTTNWDKSREGDGSENRIQFTERNEEIAPRRERNLNRISNGHSDERNQRNKPNNWNSSGESWENNQKQQQHQPPKNVEYKERSSERETAWRSDDQTNTGFGPRKPDRRAAEFTNHKRDRPVLQKHLIPRFNKHPYRSAYGHSMGNGKNANTAEGQALDSSGVYSKADSERNTTADLFSPIETTEFNGFEIKLPETLIPLGSSTKVIMVMWISPHEFYVQLKSYETSCDEMMKQIQLYYKTRTPTKLQPPIGGLAIVREKSNSVLKRAKILNYNATLDKYKIQFIDYGNKIICQLNDIYEMEKSFTRLPSLAIWCSFSNVIRTMSRDEIQQKLDAYITGKQNMMCEFVSTVQDITNVEFNIDGVSLCESMKNDGILIDIPKGVNIYRLAEQIIQISPTNIKNLTCFQAQIFGCDTTFMCSYNDLKIVKQKPNLSKEFQSFKDKYITVKVDAVTNDNVLILTIYLPFLTDTPAPLDIPFYPIYRNEFVSQVVHVESINEVYVQSNEHMNCLAAFLDDLFNFYENNGAPYINPTVSSLCVALSADGNYYRGIIQSINSDETVIVRYIDYGNCEIIPTANLKQLDSKFKIMSALAIKMFIPIKSVERNVSITDIVSEMSILTTGYELKLKILECYRTHWIIDLTSHGFSLINILQEKGLTEEIRLNEMEKVIDLIIKTEKRKPKEVTIVETPLNEPKIQPEQKATQPIEASNVVQEKIESGPPKSNIAQASTAVTANRMPTTEISIVQTPLNEPKIQLEHKATQPMEVSKGLQEKIESGPPKSDIAQASATITDNKLAAYISHTDHPNRFYLQLESDSDAIAAFQQSLQIVASSFPPLTDFRAGVSCIGQYSVDEQWYRAKIIDTDGEITSIQFIDYGNTDSITNNNLLKTCNEQFEGIKNYALACALPVQPRNSSEWNDEACNKLRGILEDLIHFEFISEDPNQNYVNLFVGDRDVSKELIAEGHAIPLEIIKSNEKCFVSHINSLNDFYIQLNSRSNALDLIADYLSDISKFDVLTELKKDTICIALFEDNCYYRAKILNNTKAGDDVRVFFIDFGNTFMAKEVRSLSKEIAELPQLSKRCCLQLPADVKVWSDKAENRFREITDEGKTVLTVCPVKPGKQAIVELLIDGKPISAELSTLCEKQINVFVDDSDTSIFEKSVKPVKSIANPKARLQGYVTHVNSPFDFYIQLDIKTNEIEVMAANLQAAYEFPLFTPEEVTDNLICAALHNDDCFYRAKILNKDNDGYNVNFIDFGNESISKELRKLPSPVKEIEPLAVHCKLDATINSFNKKETEQFQAIASDLNEDTFQEFEIVDNSSIPIIVNFYHNQENICQLIKKQNDSLSSNITGQIETDSMNDSDVVDGILSNLIQQVVANE